MLLYWHIFFDIPLGSYFINQWNMNEFIKRIQESFNFNKVTRNNFNKLFKAIIASWGRLTNCCLLLLLLSLPVIMRWKLGIVVPWHLTLILLKQFMQYFSSNTPVVVHLGYEQHFRLSLFKFHREKIIIMVR